MARTYLELLKAYNLANSRLYALTEQGKTGDVIAKPVVSEDELNALTKMQRDALEGRDKGYETLRNMCRARALHEHPALNALLDDLQKMQDLFESHRKAWYQKSTKAAHEASRRLEARVDASIVQYFVVGNARALKKHVRESIQGFMREVSSHKALSKKTLHEAEALEKACHAWFDDFATHLSSNAFSKGKRRYQLFKEALEKSDDEPKIQNTSLKSGGVS
ncbi:MAG: hypothetical protein P1U32_05305 [Legionellaceae bacterium]|nr:hypothetical protein [Legionellaceae bacterium]